MKSSPKYLPAEELKDYKNWNPSSFQSDQNPADQIQIDEILEILNGFLPGQEHAAGHGHQSFIQAGTQLSVSNWLPDELHWVAPFETDQWDTLPEFSTHQHTVEQTHEVLENLPGLEERTAEILAGARVQADEMIFGAQKSADELIAQAQEEIRSSVAEGYKQGWDAAQAEATPVLQAAHQIVAELTQWRAEMLASSESTIISIIRDIAKFMFGDGVKLDEMALQMNLNRVLENAKSLGNVRIFLNPSDAIRLDPSWKDYQGMLTGNKVIIVPSEGIKPGGCFVQGETGSIDARVEAQMTNALGVFDQTYEVD